MPKHSQGWEEGGEGGTAAFPRYARVNTLKISLAEARSQLLSPLPPSLPTSSSTTTSSSFSRVGFTADQIKDDEHIPNLLLFPPGSDLHDHPLVKSGALILQDKASCFPVHVLLGKEGGREGRREEWWVGDVIDACAAPGNKTSHAAALLQEQATEAAAAAAAAAGGGCQTGGSAPRPASVSSVVYALDRDRHRLDVLRERVIGLMGAKGGLVVPLLQDFLAVNQQQQLHQQSEGKGGGGKKGKRGKMGVEGGREGGMEGRFREVRAIMLDPSCSGSGMIKSMERRVEEEEEEGNERKKGGRKQWTPRDLNGGGKKGKEGEEEEGEEEEEERRSTKAVIKDGGATQRLRALSQFQFKALVKALVDFPMVNRVVYSTCSIHVEENEMVVAAALEWQRKAYGEGADKEGKEGGGAVEGKRKAGEKNHQKQQQRRLGPFELVRALPSWPRRGLSRTLEGRETGLSEEEANCLVRTDPQQDLTNGFFVAYFERKGTGGAGKDVKVNVNGGGQKGKRGTVEAVATVGGMKRPREEGEGTEEEGGGSGRSGVSSKQNKSAKRRERRKKQKRLAGEGGGEGDGEAGGGEVQETVA